MVDEFHLIALQ